MDGGAWWATVHGVAKSQTRLSDFTFRAIQEVSGTLYSFGFWHIWNSKEIHSLTISNLILC